MGLRQTQGPHKLETALASQTGRRKWETPQAGLNHSVRPSLEQTRDSGKVMES